MTLTIGHAPLAGDPAQRNYRIEGPAHRLFFEEHPRRIRARLGDRTVLDTVRGRLLHETGLLPVLYAPLEDIAGLEPSERRTRCPFKGEASYFSLRAGDRLAPDAVWTYAEPLPDAAWLRGYAALYWHRVDAWYEEDEEIRGHLRDPYHRVDVRRSSRPAEVRVDGEVVAACATPHLLFETQLPTRAYLPRDAVRGELVRSEKRTICPYKGEASYFSLKVGDRVVEDAAWCYEEPLPDARAIAGLLSFAGEGVETAIAAPQGESDTVPWSAQTAAA